MTVEQATAALRTARNNYDASENLSMYTREERASELSAIEYTIKQELGLDAFLKIEADVCGFELHPNQTN